MGNKSLSKSLVKWDQEHQLLRIICRGNFTKNDATSQADQIEQTLALNQISPPVRCLTDLTKAGRATIDAQLVFINLMRSPLFSRQAFYGMQPLTLGIITIILTAAGAKSVRFFPDKDSALTWLNQP